MTNGYITSHTATKLKLPNDIQKLINGFVQQLKNKEPWDGFSLGELKGFAEGLGMTNYNIVGDRRTKRAYYEAISKFTEN